MDRYVFIDTETTDNNGSGALDPFGGGDIAVVQTNIDGNIEIRRWEKETIEWLRKLNEEGYTFVFHNAEFDLRWMRKYGLKLDKVYDTMIASQVLNAGINKVDSATLSGMRVEAKHISSMDESSLMDEEDEYAEVKNRVSNSFSHSLAATVKRYTGITITKDMGLSDWGVVFSDLSKPVEELLSPSQIRYAKEDVTHLPAVLKAQSKYITQLGLEKVIALEMDIINANVDIMTNGILLDAEHWREDIKEKEELANVLEKELNEEIGAELGEKMGGDDDSLLFGVQTVEFNVSSPSQLLSFFADFFVDGKPLEKVDELTLKKVDHPIIPKLLKYKENKKLATTYGEKFLSKISPVDGRIHASLKQTQTATGRYSSLNPNL